MAVFVCVTRWSTVSEPGIRIIVMIIIIIIITIIVIVVIVIVVIISEMGAGTFRQLVSTRGTPVASRTLTAGVHRPSFHTRYAGGCVRSEWAFTASR